MKMNKLKDLFAKNSEYIHANLMKSDYRTDLLKLFVFATFAKSNSILQAFEDSATFLVTEIKNIDQLKILLNALNLTEIDFLEYVY